MAKHVNKSSNIRRIVVKRNFDALYKSRNSGDTYSEQDMQHLKLIEPNAVLPRGYTSIPRIPRSPRINRSVNKAALDNFEKEYEAFIAAQKRLKAEREQAEAATKAAELAKQDENIGWVGYCEPVEPIGPIEQPEIKYYEVTEPVEVKNEVTSEETVTSENTEEVPVVETKPKKRTKKKTVAEPVDTVTETPETAESAE